MENWQSEYLQFTLVHPADGLAACRRARRSPRSSTRSGPSPTEEQKVGEHATADSPRWARVARPAAVASTRTRSLLVMATIWLGTWFAQSVTGWSAYNADQLDHHEATVTLARLPRLGRLLGDAPCRTGSPSSSPSARWRCSASTCASADRRSPSPSAPRTRRPGSRAQNALVERERVDGGRALAAQLAGDHRQRPAAEAHVVDEQAARPAAARRRRELRRARSRPAARSWPSRAAAGCPRRARAAASNGRPSAAASRAREVRHQRRPSGATASPSTHDRRRCHVAHRLGRRGDELVVERARPRRRPARAGPSRRRRAAPARGPPRRARRRGASSSCPSASGAIFLTSISSGCERRCSDGVAHQRRVERPVEARPGADRAEAAVRRVAGRRAPPAARASGSARRRRTRPSPPARAGAARSRSRSARRRRPSRCRPRATQRVPCSLTAPSTSSTLSIASSRPCPRLTAPISSCVVAPPRRRGARARGSTSSRGGNACSMKKSWIRRSSAPRSSTTSARSIARPARPTCW